MAKQNVPQACKPGCRTGRQHGAGLWAAWTEAVCTCGILGPRAERAYRLCRLQVGTERKFKIKWQDDYPVGCEVGAAVWFATRPSCVPE